MSEQANTENLAFRSPAGLVTERLRIGGVRTRALRLPVDRQDAPLVLCLHGWGDSADAFKPLFHALEGAGAELLALDLPDCGEADALAAGPRLPQFIGFVASALAELGHARRVLAVGQSLGGRALLTAAATGADGAVQHIVAVAPAPLALPGWQQLLVRNGRLMPSVSQLGGDGSDAERIAELVASYKRTCFLDASRVHGEVFEDYARHISAERARQHIEALRRLGEELSQPLDLRGLRCPVDLVWGAQDRIAPISGAERYRAVLPQARFTRLDACGHHAHLERVAAVAAVISAALGEVGDLR